jgi:hypothetical protein
VSLPLVLRLWMVCAAAITAFGADASRVVYSKTFPGSTPPFVVITVHQDGEALYNETKDPDNDEKIRLEPEYAREIFELAGKLDHFKKPLESGLKVANMGQKTFRWEFGAERNEASFNYSTMEEAKTLAARFDCIVDSVRLLMEFRRVLRYDRLGANAAVNRAYALWENKRLVATPEFLPLLEKVAKDEAYIHMAREKAARLVDAIHAAGN